MTDSAKRSSNTNKFDNQNIPCLSFNRGNETWNIKKLGDISTLQDGTHSTPHYTEEGVPFYSVETITSNSNPKYISLEEHKKLIKRCEPHKNDILITRIGTLCESKIITWDNEFSIYVSLALISNIEILPEFLNQYIKTDYYKKEYIKRSLLLAVPQKINLKDLKETIVKYPSLKEQEKIADFLSTIDRKIDLMEKKSINLKIFQKYLLKNMFSNIKLDEPAIRFKEFDNDLKICHIKDLLKESKIKSDDDLNKRLSVKLHLKGIYKREIKTVEKEGATTQYLRKKGQFIYGKQNLHNGAFGIIPEKLDNYLSSSDIPSFDFITDINKLWFLYNLSDYSYYSRLENYSTGTGSKRISPETFLNLKIKVPSIEEQNKIAHILSNIEKRIQTVDKKVETNKSFKKSLLSKMFC